MTNIFKIAIAFLVLTIATSAIAQPAMKIDPDGNVAITGDASVTGTFTAKNVQADNLNAILADIKAQNALILESQTWVLFAPNMRDAMNKVLADNSLTNTYEFLTNRNVGARGLHFSNWNGGLRAMTDPFLIGDTQPFSLGGAAWLVGTKDPDQGTCNDTQVLHRYYQSKSTGIQTIWGNGCRPGPAVYARKRLFQ